MRLVRGLAKWTADALVRKRVRRTREPGKRIEPRLLFALRAHLRARAPALPVEVSTGLRLFAFAFTAAPLTFTTISAGLHRWWFTL